MNPRTYFKRQSLESDIKRLSALVQRFHEVEYSVSERESITKKKADDTFASVLATKAALTLLPRSQNIPVSHIHFPNNFLLKPASLDIILGTDLQTISAMKHKVEKCSSFLEAQQQTSKLSEALKSLEFASRFLSTGPIVAFSALIGTISECWLYAHFQRPYEAVSVGIAVSLTVLSALLRKLTNLKNNLQKILQHHENNDQIQRRVDTLTTIYDTFSVISFQLDQIEAIANAIMRFISKYLQSNAVSNPNELN